MILAQAKLCFEEMMELLEAVGVKVTYLGLPPASIVIDRKQCQLFSDPNAVIDIVEVAKEAADVSVVNTGMLSEFGISDTPVLEEVDANNLGKFDPKAGGYLDGDRKWRKPANYPKPDLKRILVAQGYKPEVSHEKRTQGEANDVPLSDRGNGQEGQAQETSGGSEI